MISYGSIGSFRHAFVLLLAWGFGPEAATMVFLSLLLASLIATIHALVRRFWSVMATAAALRWRVGLAGWLALLLAGLVVGVVGGPGIILVHPDLVWILFAGLLTEFIALAWKQPPWMPARLRPER
jgi:hypothetical protein